MNNLEYIHNKLMNNELHNYNKEYDNAFAIAAENCPSDFGLKDAGTDNRYLECILDKPERCYECWIREIEE